MDIPARRPDQQDLARRLARGLDGAARSGLVQVTEAGMTDWAYLDALRRLRDATSCRCGCGSSSPAASPTSSACMRA